MYRGVVARTPLVPLALFAMVACGGRLGLELPDPLEDAGAVDAGPDTNVAGVTTVFAVSLFRIGITTRAGETSDTAWKELGFNLDGLCTTATESKGSCTPTEGGKPSALADGDDCLDNNFGSQLVPLIKGLDGAAETKIVDGIKKGGLTLVLRIDDLAPSGDDGGAAGALFAAKAASGKAALDGTDTWDVDPGSVTAADLGKPVARLKGVVVTTGGKRVWRGTADRLDLPAVFIAGASGTVPLSGLRLEIDLATKVGNLGGYALVTDIQKVVGGVLAQRSLCPGNILYEQVMKNILQGADMPTALPQNPAQVCGSLSLGLGVEVVGGTLGKVLPPGEAKPNPCAK